MPLESFCDIVWHCTVDLCDLYVLLLLVCPLIVLYGMAFLDRLWYWIAFYCGHRFISISVLYFFVEQLSHGKVYENLKVCVLYIHSWKFHAKIWSRSKVIKNSCFLSFHLKFCIRKFGIVVKGSDCETLGPGFESSLR